MAKANRSAIDHFDEVQKCLSQAKAIVTLAGIVDDERTGKGYPDKTMYWSMEAARELMERAEKAAWAAVVSEERAPLQAVK